MVIATIDFDIIMAPDIESYNDFVGDFQTIDDLIEEFPYMHGIKADLYKYDYLTQFLLKQLKEIGKENIIFIDSHEEAVSYIKKNSKVINIDHHHDLGYDEKAPVLAGSLTCANWVKHLLDTKKIKLEDYIWVCNKNSIVSEDYSNVNIQLFDNFDFENCKIDKLIICLSPEWIPQDYQILYHTWENIVEAWENK